MIEKLKNIAKIKLKNASSVDEQDKYYLISKILEDEECFKKMKTATAYKLLSDLDFELSDIKKIYDELIFN